MRYIKRVLDISHDLERKSQFLFGPRQTGKTSWIREELDGVSYRFNLLDKKLVKALQNDPALFAGMLRREGIDSGLVVVDEIQKLPFLLDEVHNLIESTDIRFLLTGSSARRLREQGTNLLGGRAGWKEMYPLVWPEIKDDAPELDSVFKSGLIPAMYLSDDSDSDLFDYVQLYLNEEIQAEGLVRNLPSFERFLEVAALSNSEMLNYENISKDVGVSRSAVISWFQILYDTLIAFEVPAYTKTKKRKAYASSKFYMFDIGVIRHLLGFEKIEAGSTEYGKFFKTYMAMEMRAYIGYRSRPKLNITPLGYWRSLSGFEVDFILMEKVAIETKTTRRHTARDLKGLKALKEEGLFSRYILVCNEDYAQTTEDDIEIVPWRQFLDELWAGKII